MKAIVYNNYGSPEVLQQQKVEKPSPKANEVVIKVHTTSLNAADSHLLKGKPFMIRLDGGLRKPKHPILGADVAGTIETVGSDVTKFKVGDEVFGDLSGYGFGGFAEYVCADVDILVKKPETMSFEIAAALPMASVTALQGLRKGKIKEGQKVLINGASGGVGTFAVQIAKALGAEVTAICSTAKMDMVRSLGADHVIDYTQTPFSDLQKTYDFIFAVNGNESVQSYKGRLEPSGICIVSGGSMSQIFGALLLGPITSIRNNRKVTSLLAKANAEDLTFITKLVEEGKISPVIDKHYDLNDIPEAMAYLGAGHAKGKIIINIA